jgi:microsomal dipeptidase-like Zn-dependent dipeptidase
MMAAVMLGVGHAAAAGPPKGGAGAVAKPSTTPSLLPRTPPSVWGFADLHTHPAVHLALGAEEDGSGGIYYGKPGMRLEDATMATDLAPCDREKHGKFDGDYVRHETRQTIMQKVNQITGHTHGSSGWPDFKTWPSAMTTNHQQMHIEWIRRAFDGGLRILVASAMENLSFRTLWRNGFSVAPPSLRASNAEEFASAVRQLEFIRRMVSANASWMQIVKTSAEARGAIEQGKLAVILGTELDTLTVEQFIQLKTQQDVRLIIPAHVVDSPIAGAAVYEGLFNTHNWFVNGVFFHVVGDPNLRTRLGKPSILSVQTSIWPLDGPGAVAPQEIDQGQYCGLRYECCVGSLRVPGCVPSSEGHKNERGLLDEPGFKRLMREGFLLDLAHMSDRAQTDAVRLATMNNYPMLDSHTGMRRDGETAENERAIRTSLMKTLAGLGGVMGIGTGGLTAGGATEARNAWTIDGFNVTDGARKNRMVRFTGQQRDAVFAFGPHDAGAENESCESASVTVRTGGDDLRGGDDGARILFNARTGTTEVDLSSRARWGNHSSHAALVSLPRRTRIGDITGVTLVHTGSSNTGGASSDNWNVDSLVIECSGPSARLLEMSGAPIMRFTGGNNSWRAPLEHAGSGEVRALMLTIRTGGDDLRGGNDNATATIDLGTSSVDCPLNGGEVWGNHSLHTVRCALPAGTQRSSLREVRIKTSFSGGIGGDNWNMDSIQVSAETAGRRLLSQTGTPLIRFTAEQRSRVVYAPTRRPEANPLDMPATSILKMWVRTTTDDLRGENDNARVVLEIRDGTSQEFPMNEGGKWDGGEASKESLYHVLLRLRGGKVWSDIRNVRIKTSLAGGLNSDNWDIGKISIEVYPDPITAWTRDLHAATTLLGDGKVAIGTDFNGLAPQIPMSSLSSIGAFSYPRELQPPYPARPVALGSSRAGRRTFEVVEDGLAHIGMEPDFLHAAALAGGVAKIAPIFRSAEMVIRMWEKVESAAPNVR